MVKIRVLSGAVILVVGLLCGEICAAPRKPRAAKKGGKKRGGAKGKSRGTKGAPGGGGGAPAAASAPVVQAVQTEVPLEKKGGPTEEVVPVQEKKDETTTGSESEPEPEVKRSEQETVVPVPELDAEAKKRIAQLLAQDAKNAAEIRMLRQETRALEIIQDPKTSPGDRQYFLSLLQRSAQRSRDLEMDQEFQKRIDSLVAEAKKVVK